MDGDLLMIKECCPGEPLFSSRSRLNGTKGLPVYFRIGSVDEEPQILKPDDHGLLGNIGAACPLAHGRGYERLLLKIRLRSPGALFHFHPFIAHQ